MSRYLQALAAFWQARAPRERLFLAALAVFLVLALLINGLWHAHQARAHLRQQLPQLRLQLAAMQQQAADIRALQSQPVNPPLGAASLQQTAETLLLQAGLKLGAGQLQTAGARQLRLQAELPFERWLDALALLQRDARLRLVQSRVEATGSPGQVRIDALFSLPEPN
ncbi:putative General secretion pathway M protein [Sterolibacterium denitrificans]|uniref:General secretion pathway M protein n=1 Tax=Sterolibacterium denitrificans TaxID=157592 RepID=A0A7Z7HRD9_9PROT|nr:type II secretion system protein GspM [Sterolibacterium denitrificans]SMB25912.1 putative General secretion pathway M protein [Sterolibacterium denitrificans]